MDRMIQYNHCKRNQLLDIDSAILLLRVINFLEWYLDHLHDQHRMDVVVQASYLKLKFISTQFKNYNPKIPGKNILLSGNVEHYL